MAETLTSTVLQALSQLGHHLPTLQLPPDMVARIDELVATDGDGEPIALLEQTLAIIDVAQQRALDEALSGAETNVTSTLPTASVSSSLTTVAVTVIGSPKVTLAGPPKLMERSESPANVV